MSSNSVCSRVLRLLTCAGGTGPMTGLTSSSVTIVICTRVTGHLTLVCLKTGKRNRKSFTLLTSYQPGKKWREGGGSSVAAGFKIASAVLQSVFSETIFRKNGEKHQLQHQWCCVGVHISGWTFSSHFFLFYLLLDSSAVKENWVFWPIFTRHILQMPDLGAAVS